MISLAGIWYIKIDVCLFGCNTFKPGGLSAFCIAGKPLQEGVHVCCFSIFKSIEQKLWTLSDSWFKKSKF
jgi:hypothetical protein